MPAKSEKQRRFFGAVMGAKKHKGKVKGAAAKAAKEMTTSQIKDFLHKEEFNNFKEFFPIWEQKCWKGYYKAGMKKKGGKMVNDCRPIKKKLTESVITENYKICNNFQDLPTEPPHGFWITKTGQFIPVFKMFGHDEALKALFPNIIAGKQGIAALQSAMKHGMIRVAKMGNDFGLTYHPMYASNAAKKTAKDIAAFYNMGVKDDFEGL